MASPGEGRGEDGVFAGLDELFDAVEKLLRLDEATHEIGGEHEIELAEIGAQIARVALLESHAIDAHVRVQLCHQLLVEVALERTLVPRRLVLTQQLAGTHETRAVVDADHVVEQFGQLETRAANRTAHV